MARKSGVKERAGRKGRAIVTRASIKEMPPDITELDYNLPGRDETETINKYERNIKDVRNTDLDPLQRLMAQEAGLNPDDLDSTPGEIQLNDQQLSELRSVVGRERIRNKLFRSGYDKEEVDIMMQNIERYLDKNDNLSETGDWYKVQRRHFVKKDNKNIIKRSEHSKRIARKISKQKPGHSRFKKVALN